MDTDRVPSKPLRRRLTLKQILLRFTVAFSVAIMSLKAADAIYGWADDTQVRHRLRLTPNADVQHHTTEFNYQFRTNSLGFRGADYPVAKPPGTIRVVVLGDSFIAGFGVRDDDLLTGHLERLLNQQPSGKSRQRYEVINAGRCGTSTIRELEIYERTFRRFQPDIVVLAFFLGNDLTEVVNEEASRELTDFRPQGALRSAAYFWCPNFYLQMAILKRQFRAVREIGARSEDEVLASLRTQARQRGLAYEDVERRFRALPVDARAAVAKGLFPLHVLNKACLAPDAHRRSIHPDSAFFNQAWPRVEKHLKLLHDVVRQDGAQLTIMVIPAAVQVDVASAAAQRDLGFDVDPDWLTSSGQTERALRAWAEDHEIPYLDLTPQLRASPEQLYYRWDFHFNAAGHLKSAQLLRSFLLHNRNSASPSVSPSNIPR